MIIEHIKSVVLFLLVALSLLLTFALWNYQPQYEDVEQQEIIDDTKLNGEEETISDIIFPKRLVFHNYDQHKMFSNKGHEIAIYQDIITNWTISSINLFLSSPEEVDFYLTWTDEGWVSRNNNQSLEIQFAIDLPMAIIRQLFSFKSDTTTDTTETTWNKTFDRIFFTLDHTTDQIRISFASDQHKEVLQGRIQSSKAFETIQNLLESQSNMVALKEYQLEGGHSFLLPTDNINLKSYALVTQNLPSDPLENVLFPDPSLIKVTTSNPLNNNLSLTDGSRLLTRIPVFNNDYYIEFENLLLSAQGFTNAEELILDSLSFTNDHRGWTNDFKIDDINEDEQEIAYRMYYDMYPIFDSGQTEMIQVWSHNKLIRLKRPLFRISEDFSQPKQLKTGDAIFQTLNNLSERSFVREIRIGYRFSELQNNVLMLEPEWHVKYKNSWYPISYFDRKQTNQEVE